MLEAESISIIKEESEKAGVDWQLMCAMAMQESGGDSFRTRFEPNTQKYLVDAQTYANKLGITRYTEQIHQMMSWGMLQTMGFLCREYKYEDHLTKLTDPRTGVQMGCKHVAKLMKKYKEPSDIIAAYNAGSVRISDGKYFNQDHVDKVMRNLKEVKKLK